MERKSAHQNAKAFKHNKHSKLTQKIAKEPLDCLCERCASLLEWKKRYRKYKLRTVPGRCDLCMDKAVLKGHRKICDPCGKRGKVCTKCGGSLSQAQEGIREETQAEEISEDDPQTR